MKKLFAVLVVVAFVGLLVLPQPAVADVKLGVKVGANGAKIFGEDADIDLSDWKTKLGFCAGGFLTIELGRILSVQPEVLYTMKGSQMEEVVDGSTYTGKLYFDYLEIPLLLKLRLPTGSVAPFVFAGPSVGFVLKSKLKYFQDGQELGEEDIDDLKSVDYGIIFGGGLNLGSSLHVDVRYSMGLQKLIDDPDLGAIDIKNGVLSATIGLAF